MPKKPIYEAVVRPNGRGGYEVAEYGAPVGMGIGNHPTFADAYFVASYNYEPSRIKEEPEAQPVAPKAKLKLRQAKKEGSYEN